MRTNLLLKASFYLAAAEEEVVQARLLSLIERLQELALLEEPACRLELCLEGAKGEEEG